MSERVFDDGSAGDVHDGVIGVDCAVDRKPDPRIAAQILRALGDAQTVLDVGAGTRSYEPTGRQVTAVEPSATMRAQRPPGPPPAIDAVAEALPFADDAFDAVMASSKVHQWPDLARGIAEMKRVSRGPVVVAVSDPDRLHDCWRSAWFAEPLDRKRAWSQYPFRSIAPVASPKPMTADRNDCGNRGCNVRCRPGCWSILPWCAASKNGSRPIWPPARGTGASATVETCRSTTAHSGCSYAHDPAVSSENWPEPPSHRRSGRLPMGALLANTDGPGGNACSLSSRPEWRDLLSPQNQDSIAPPGRYNGASPPMQPSFWHTAPVGPKDLCVLPAHTKSPDTEIVSGDWHCPKTGCPVSGLQ